MEGTAKDMSETFNNLKGKVYAIPTVDDTLTKQGYSADAKKVGEELGKRVKSEDIVNTFDSVATDKPASANTVRVLANDIKNINKSEASGVNYDGSESGLVATNMQGAIDEVAKKIGDTNDTLDDLETSIENCMPKTGGMVEGDLKFRSDKKGYGDGYGQVAKNHSEEDDFGTELRDVTLAGQTAKLSVCALYNLLAFTDREGIVRDIHHEGNKPFGEYKGNGSAVSRMIETGGIGRLAIVYNKDNFSFVTPQGALSVDTSAGTIEWIASPKVYFLNGTLGITTSSEAFNVADKEYYYQVI